LADDVDEVRPLPSSIRNLSRLILDKYTVPLSVAVIVIVCSPDVLNAREAMMIVEVVRFGAVSELRVSPSI